MHCIFGFGGWNRFYLYLLIAALAKFLKEDIIVGDNETYSFKLEIAKHKFMILLFGYLSNAIFGILLIKILKILEKRRSQNNLLLSENIESQRNTSLGDLIEMKNRTKSINNGSEIDKNDEKKLLNITNSLNSTNDNEKNESNLISRRYSLIHVNLLENISGNAIKYIIISCSLIIIKEILIEIIYTTNDIFDYYFAHLIIITLILKYFFKVRIYNHRMVAVIFDIILSGGSLVLCLFINNYSKDDQKRTLKELFTGHYYKIVIAVLLYLIFSFLFCIGIIIQKNIMENKFISPYKIIIFKGIIGIIVSIIGLIISSLWKCPKEYEQEEDNKNKTNKDEAYNRSFNLSDYQNFKFFVCAVQYPNQTGSNKTTYYYDHFIGYFSLVNKKTIEPLSIILYCIINFITEICLIFINKYFSPTHYLIAESLYSLIHIPMDYFSVISYKEMKEKIQDDQKADNKSIYLAIVHTIGTRILRFISCFCDFFAYTIYLEIIELKFCGLNQNIKKNIQKRASIDANDDNLDNSSSDSDEGNEEETKKDEQEVKKDEPEIKKERKIHIS